MLPSCDPSHSRLARDLQAFCAMQHAWRFTKLDRHIQAHCWLQVGGYIARLVARQQADLSAYITSLVLVIMAPNFLALVSYYASGKVPHNAEPARSQQRLHCTATLEGIAYGVQPPAACYLFCWLLLAVTKDWK